VYVYGRTAAYTDFTHVLSSKMPYFIGAVVLLSYLLLTIAFRSLLVQLTTALMNFFAAGASFGVIVAIFQSGWGAEALGIGKGGPIEAFAPVLFFAILFGLSIDYQVFLVSRTQRRGAHEDQPAGHHRRPAGDRRDHHRRGDHHDRGVQRVRPGR
jgi:RND superfamily putative drug exporter